MKQLLPATAFALLLLAAPAQAQSARTWISGVGDDTQPCARSSPCKTFAGGIMKTLPFGTVSVLDPGGYGLITVSKSISIIAEGTQAGILASGADAVTISAGPNDVVRLRGLIIEAATPGSNTGIRIASAASVYIDHCSIRGFATGISLESPGVTKVFVSDCSISLNTTGVQATVGQGEVVLDHVSLVRNQTAVYSKGNPTAFHLNNSTLADNKLAIGQVTGKIVSSRTNVFSGNGSNGQTMGTEPLR